MMNVCDVCVKMFTCVAQVVVNVENCCVCCQSTGDKRTVIRWGIISAGFIASDFCLALRTLPADEHQVVKLEDVFIACPHSLMQYVILICSSTLVLCLHSFIVPDSPTILVFCVQTF